MQNQWINNETDTWNSQAYPLGTDLRNDYGADFKHVIMSSWTDNHILSYGDKNLKESGNYMEPGITDMLFRSRCLKATETDLMIQSFIDTAFPINRQGPSLAEYRPDGQNHQD